MDTEKKVDGMMDYISCSPEETEQVAADFAASLKGGEIIAFEGDLGMGKTCFVRGLARGLGFEGEVNSPTFSIVNEYLGGRLPLYHFDMYRINSWEDLEAVSFFEYADSGGVTAVEWSENIENALPADVIKVQIIKTGDFARRIVIKGRAVK